MNNYIPLSILNYFRKSIEKTRLDQCFLIKLIPYININVDSERVILQTWPC